MPVAKPSPMPLSNLFDALFDDLARPGMPRQAGVVLACILFGWLSTRLVRFWWRRRHGQEGQLLHPGVESFTRVAAPLLVVGTLTLAQYVFAKHRYHTNIIKVSISVFWSLAAIRAVFYVLRRVFARRGHLGEAFVTFERIFVLIVWLAVVLYITGLWPDIWDFLDTYTLKYGPRPNDNVSLADILQGILSVAVMLMLALWAGTALEERLMALQALHTSLRVALARLGKAVLIVAGGAAEPAFGRHRPDGAVGVRRRAGRRPGAGHAAHRQQLRVRLHHLAGAQPVDR